MMKRSAGILVYRTQNRQIEVLLCHMGGPYWQEIDNGGWSIPKGEMKDEKAIFTAIREFQEETSFQIKKETLTILGSRKQSSNKLVIIFTSERDYDSTKAYSNKFQLEWPKGSGKITEFPEMDRAEWIPIVEAKRKILKGQVYFLSKLEEKLNSKEGTL